MERWASRAAGLGTVLLLAPATATAGVVSRGDPGGGQVITYQAAANATNPDRIDLAMASDGSEYSFYTGQGGDTITAGPGCSEFAAGIVDCQATGTVSMKIFLLGGDDRASVQFSKTPMRVEGGEGSDELYGGMAADVLLGEAGDDKLGDRFGTPGQLWGGPGSDTFYDVKAGDLLRGEDGDDTFDRVSDGATGADISGGGGTDTLIAATPSTNVAQEITLDDLANDTIGAGSGINAHADLENVTASAGDDKLTGSAVANRLDGGAGKDAIAGGLGNDTLLGGTGDDEIDAQDGAVDTVDCGVGNDRAQADPNDSVTGCEVVFEDTDRDGAAKGPDCDDTNPAIRPGANDVPDNGVDEDCSNGDAVILDRDRDGFDRPGDCDDNNSAIHLGVPEIPGNTVDENCDGTKAPYPRIASSVAHRWKVFAGYTLVLELSVRDAPVGATAAVRCRGRGCPRKVFRMKSKGAKELRFARYFRNRKLRPGATVHIKVTLPDTIGKVTRLPIKRGKIPKATVLCLAPDASKPAPCAPGS